MSTDVNICFDVPVEEAPVGAVRPHIIVFRLIPHVSTRMLLGGVKELM
jgi:hypothetical protein